MIDIYLYYFNEETVSGNGEVTTQLVTSGRLIQSVPCQNASNIVIMSPTVKNDIGNAESMDFSVQPGTPYYNAFIQMRTFIRVDYENTTIFYGRVLTISDGYFGERKVHCEGALAFLNDSYYPAVDKNAKQTISIHDHICSVLSNHNSQLNDPYRSIQPGEIPGNYSNSISSEQRIPNESREFESTSWNNSKSVLEDLKSHYGGAFRIRYSSGSCYLDWLDHYYRSTVNSQIVETGNNLIDVGSSTEVSNIFTAVIPIGKSNSGDGKIYISGYRTDLHSQNYLTVPQICKSLNANSFYTDEELNSGYHTAEDYKTAVDRYGLIFKVVDLQEAHTQEKLLEEAAKWIKQNYQGGVDTFSVKAIDLHFIGDNVDQILLGDRVRIRYPVGNRTLESSLVTRTLTCTSVTYDIFNPENNQYSFGIPANMLSRTYGDSSTKKSGKTSSSYTPPKEPPEEEEGDSYEQWASALLQWLKNTMVWKKSTGGRESGPTATLSDDTELFGYFLETVLSKSEDGHTMVSLWAPIVKGVQTIPGTNDIQYVWDRDSSGRPKGTYVIKKASEMTVQVLEGRKIFEYVKDEHGVDLRGGLTAKMPSVVTTDDGGVSIYTMGEDGSLREILKLVPGGDEVLSVFDSFGMKIAKVLTSDGSWSYLQLDDEGHPVYDDDGQPVYINIESIRRSTSDLAKDIESMGHTVSLLDSDVNLIGQKIGDTTYGLIKDLADLNLNVTSISSEVNLIGQYMDRSVADLTLAVAKQDATITVLSDEITYIGQHNEDSLTELITDLSGVKDELGNQRYTISAITSDVDIIGQKVGDNTAGLIKDLADLGKNVLSITTDVNLIGDKIGDDTRGLIKEIADAKMQIDGQDVTITAITTDLNMIGNVVGDSTKGLVKDLLAAGQTITMLNNAINIINANQLTPEQQQMIRDYAEQGLTVTAFGSDLITFRGKLDGHQARIGSLETTRLKTSELYGEIASLESVNVKALTSERGGIDVYSVSTTGFYQGDVYCYIPHGIRAVRVVETSTPGTYNLEYQTFASFDSDSSKWSVGGTFSKATSTATDFYLSGSWSGTGSNAHFTVTAKDTQTDNLIEGKILTRHITVGTKENQDGSAYTSGKTFYIPIRTYYGPTPPTYEDTGYRVYVDATNVYNSGADSVGLSDVAWSKSSLSSINTTNNFTYSTSGRKTISEASTTRYLKLAADSTWSNGSKTVWLNYATTGSALNTDDVTPVGKVSISIPDPGSTVWMNTEGNKWRTEVMVGGKLIRSAERNFATDVNNAWIKAVTQSQRPTIASNVSAMVMSWPQGSTPNDDPTERTYELVVEADDNYAYLRTTEGNNSINVIRASTSDVFSKGADAGADSVGLSDVTWSKSGLSSINATNNFTYKTSGRRTISEASITRYLKLTADSTWSNGSKTVWLNYATTGSAINTDDVTPVGKVSISIPNPGSTVWTNTEGYKWCTEVMVGGKLITSAERNFAADINAVWKKAALQSKRPTSISTGSIMEMAWPQGSSPNESPLERTYELIVDADAGYAYLQRTDSGSTANMIRASTSAVYDKGWKAGAANNIYPLSISDEEHGPDETISLRWPHKTSVGSAVTRSYTLSVDKNYATLKRSDISSATTVARIDNSGVYNEGADAGADSVGLSDVTWSKSGLSSINATNNFTYKTSGRRTISEASITRYLKLTADSTWSNGSKTVWLNYATTGSAINTDDVTPVGKVSISIPNPGSTVWTNTEDDKWCTEVMVGGKLITSAERNFATIRNDAYTKIHYITLDDSWNHNEDNWNCLIYDSEGTLLRTLRVNSAKTSGLIFPVTTKTVDITTNNSTFTYTAKTDDNVAGYTKFIVNVAVPTTSHSISTTTNSSWYTSASAGEANAKSAAAYAMGTTTDNLVHISDGVFRSNSYVWFKVTCGGRSKYYYTKIN